MNNENNVNNEYDYIPYYDKDTKIYKGALLREYYENNEDDLPEDYQNVVFIDKKPIHQAGFIPIWNDELEDWENIPDTSYQINVKKEEILRLKQELLDDDYKFIKIAEYNAVGKDIPYDLTTLSDERDQKRDRINELENEIVYS
jgi:hypothetical protein